MTICLDTDVLVDCLRGTSQAQTWLNSASNEAFLVPGIAAMELVAGCRNQADLQRVRKFLDSFDVIMPDARDLARAYDLLVTYHLSSGLNIPDCIVAAMALEHSLQLFTFNLKHYRVVEGLDVQEPYQRAMK
jgi:predicted nucleic acid-binding protein